MKTKVHPKNMFSKHILNEPVLTECEPKENKPQTYIRTIVSLREKQIVEVPRNNPHKRFNDFGIIPWSKYTLDVYLRIKELFTEEYSPDDIVRQLHNESDAIKAARLCRGFVKKAIQLVSAVSLPEMVSLVPKDGEWSLMIDGTVRAKDGMVLLIVLAVPLDRELPYIPLVCEFIPTENMGDISLILHDLKPRLPSLPKSIISDFRAGMQDAIQEIFPDIISQGCHYHIIEMVAKILVNPIINQINKRIRKYRSGIVRWAQYNIHRSKTDDSMISARILKKLCTNINGEFGGNLLNFLHTMQEIRLWAKEREKYLISNKNYKKLYKLLNNRVWIEINPLLSQLERYLIEFSNLRRCLTPTQYKTEIEPVMDTTSVVQLDNLISDWTKLGEIGDNKFNKRFKTSVECLRRHYSRIIPPLINPTLHRTTSLLENLNSQIKRFIRKWSGTRMILRSFDWAAPLATICRSLNETDYLDQIIDNLSSYDWIEKLEILSRKTREYKLQVMIANSIASKKFKGLIYHLDLMIMRDLTT